jgi:hypothetical protein
VNAWQVPAIVVAVLTWLFAPPASLGDAARREAIRRQLTPPSVRSLSDADADRLPRRFDREPATPAGADAAASARPGADVGERAETTAKEPAVTEPVHDESWWHERIATARATLARDELLAEALQTQVNVLTSDAAVRDDPAQRGVLLDQRTRSLGELNATKEKVVRDRAAIDQIQDDARKEGVPPGWVR